MATGSTTVERVWLLIRDALSVDVPDGDTDLIDSGLLDSLALVTLIVEIEDEFEVELPLEDFDLDRFRSVERIAAFLTEAYPTAT
jgi:D-alanine--poly(phosphoribitol) ligase subunit 2